MSRAGAVKVGRRSDFSSCPGDARPHLDSSEHGSTLVVVGMTMSRGARLWRTNNRAATLYSVGPMTRTMMQSCASAAKLRGGGPILHNGMKAMVFAGPRHLEPSSAIPHRGADRAETVQAIGDVHSIARVHHAGRMATPSGTTPSRTSRHNAIRSLRASATIIVLRAFGACSVRRRYHCARALFFWNRRNRHASWIMPRRTQALTDRAIPFSRFVPPLRDGEPV